MSADGDIDKKPLTAVYLRRHFKALDGVFRSLGATFKAVTFEHGRAGEEYDDYPADAREKLLKAAEHLDQAGKLLKQAALQVRAKARGVDEETE